jgi:hypothetical protein
MNHIKDIKVKFFIGFIFIGFFAINPILAQPNLPVLQTSTPSLNVREGHDLYKGYWSVSPEVKKDIYFAHRFKKATIITFYAGADSVSFKVTPQHVYDFIILLNHKDTCYTEISTIRTSYYKDCNDCVITEDTIPFTLGKDNRVYITGRVNGSVPLKFFFDDGADNTILFPSALQKGAKLEFDGSIENRAGGGTETRKTSNVNSLEISKLKWRNEQVMYVDKQIGEGDGTIGYDVFEDKIIEMDYDKQLMIIHDGSFEMGKGYAAFPMQLNGGEVPFITGTLINKEKQYSADFMFDMGATGCLFLNQGFLKKNSLYDAMETIGDAQTTGAGSGVTKTTRAILPGFIFGHFTFHNVPVNLEDPAEHDPGTGVLGMDILKRFHTIIDYQNNVIYLKPNSLIDSPYKQYRP